MASSDRSDVTLLKDFLKGDQDAFTELMQRHEDRIFGLCFKMMGERQDALEATQETFIAAFRRAASFRGDSAFSTWLYRVGINTCNDLLRKRRRTPIPSEELPMTEVVQRVDDSVVTRLDVSQALAALPEEYRVAVTMHDLGGVPYEEISVLTAAKLGTVKSRISRGRRLLADLLEQPASTGSSKETM